MHIKILVYDYIYFLYINQEKEEKKLLIYIHNLIGFDANKIKSNRIPLLFLTRPAQ